MPHSRAAKDLSVPGKASPLPLRAVRRDGYHIPSLTPSSILRQTIQQGIAAVKTSGGLHPRPDHAGLAVLPVKLQNSCDFQISESLKRKLGLIDERVSAVRNHMVSLRMIGKRRDQTGQLILVCRIQHLPVFNGNLFSRISRQAQPLSSRNILSEIHQPGIPSRPFYFNCRENLRHLDGLPPLRRQDRF